MKKNKSKTLLLAAFTGLLLLMPVRYAYIPETAEAAQVSASHDSKLSAFDIAPGVLSPAFSPDITEYTSTVEADVTSVSVQAVPRAAGAVIASVEGRDGLRPGVNTIKVTCSAQDNTFTVYTITLTVGSADAGVQQPGADAAEPAGGTQDPVSDTSGTAGDTQGSASDAGGTADTQPDTGNTADTQDGSGDGTQPDTGAEDDASQSDTGQSAQKKRSLAQRLSGTVKEDGTVKLSGAAYKLSSNFTYGTTSQDIPSAFGQGSVQIGDVNYAALYCPSNGVSLVYMENTDGKGSTGFYFYDEMKNVVERFKYTGIGDNFVIFISNAREEVPAGYEEKALKLPSEKKVAAYQSQFSDELKDYYLVYGINSDGTSGWYLYDKRQGTYMRYSSAFAAAQGQDDEDSGEDEVERTVSLTKYNTLNEKYTELKDSRVKIVSILIVAIIVLIIIFTAVLLRSHDDEDDDEENDSSVRARKTKKAKKTSRQTEAVSKSSLAAGRNFEGNVGKKSKKVTKTFTQEPQARQDHISSPEEIRAQMARGQAVPADTMQVAAERMRQSVKYPRSAPKAEAQEPVHDPMDDWDMEETASRKASKAGKASKKKRGWADDDMEIMDLNDL